MLNPPGFQHRTFTRETSRLTLEHWGQRSKRLSKDAVVVCATKYSIHGMLERAPRSSPHKQKWSDEHLCVREGKKPTMLSFWSDTVVNFNESNYCVCVRNIKWNVYCLNRHPAATGQRSDVSHLCPVFPWRKAKSCHSSLVLETSSSATISVDKSSLALPSWVLKMNFIFRTVNLCIFFVVL